jgi:hypothetical protein
LFKDEQKKNLEKQFCTISSNWINQQTKHPYKFIELCEYVQMVARNYIKYLMRFKTIATYIDNFNINFFVLIKIIKWIGLHLLFGSIECNHTYT